MSSREFFSDAARAAVKAAVERVEQQTSAEVVVAVRRRAGDYAAADLAFAAIAAFACLTFLLYSDKVFATTWIPIDAAVVFGLAALFSSRSPTLRRWLSPKSVREENVRQRAYQTFHEQKLARTSGRNGILVLVGMLERRVAVVFDLGIDKEKAGPAFDEAVKRLEASIEGASPKLADFVAALDALGPALAPSMPRRADDVNELPDDVGVA